MFVSSGEMAQMFFFMRTCLQKDLVDYVLQVFKGAMDKNSYTALCLLLLKKLVKTDNSMKVWLL